jgi:drug/metabolite transporter (DMT)-like permease
MESIIYALIAFLTWGIGITFEAIAARKLESKSFAFWGFFLGFILTSFYTPFALSQLYHLNWTLFRICYLIAFFIITGVIFYYEALKIGNPSLVGAIGSSFPFVTVILSVLFLKEKLDFQQILVISIIFIGLILSTLNINELKKKKITLNKGVFLALLTMLCWGIYATLIKIPISKIGWFWPNWFFMSSFPLIYIYMKLTKTKLEIPKKRSVILPVVLSIIFVRIAEFSYNLGLNKGNASIVAPIAGANPILFVLLSYFIFKEPLKRHQILGIIITLTGIIILSALSS